MKILGQKVDIMDALMQALEDHDSKEANNLDKDIDIEDEESELVWEQAQTTEYPTQYLVIRSALQDMIAAQNKKLTSHSNASVLAGLVEKMLMEALDVGYDASREGIRPPLFSRNSHCCHNWVVSNELPADEKYWRPLPIW